MKEKQKKNIFAVSLCVLLLVTVIGLTIAYLTDRNYVNNVFMIGNVDIQLVEPDYPTDIESRIMVPYKTIAKNPQLINSGTTDSFVFMELTVPVVNATEILSNRTRGTTEDREIFKTNVSDSANSAEIGCITYNSNWVLLSKSSDDIAHTHTYLFGYSGVLAPGESTKSLFDSVSLISILESTESANTTKNITVQGYAIQSDNIPDINATETLSRDTLEKVYEVICNQKG